MRKSLVFALILVVGCLASCSRPEKIIVKHDGLWKETEMRTTTILNGLTIADFSINSPLGRRYFDKNGTGWYEDFSGTQTINSWSMNADQDRLTINDGNGLVTDYDILAINGKSMTLKNSYTTIVSAVLVTIESTTILEQVK